MQIFLSEVRVTGIKTDVDDKIRVLVAASAIIPIFGFKEWEYDNLGEVLIYPSRFSKNYDIPTATHNLLACAADNPGDADAPPRTRGAMRCSGVSEGGGQDTLGDVP